MNKILTPKTKGKAKERPKDTQLAGTIEEGRELVLLGI
jgi:hypothetical protein